MAITKRSQIIIAGRDELLLREVRRLLPEMEIIAFVNGARVPAAMKLHPAVIAVFVENAPAMAPLELLEAARATLPDVRRALITEHCDLNLVTDGLHRGVFHKLIYRPLDSAELYDALDVCPPHRKPNGLVYSPSSANARTI